MAYAFIRNGVVENVADTAPPPGWSLPGMSVVQSNTAKVGDLYDGSTFTTPSAPVPASLSRRQCAKQMALMGLITPTEALAMTKSGDMPAMVNAMVTGQPNEAFIRIDFAADTYERANPLLNQLMTAAGYDAAAIDQFFRDAAKV